MTSKTSTTQPSSRWTIVQKILGLIGVMAAATAIYLPDSAARIPLAIAAAAAAGAHFLN